MLRRNVERVPLKDAADDHHPMRPHNVDHGVARELREPVGADHCIIVTCQMALTRDSNSITLFTNNRLSAAQSMRHTMRLRGKLCFAFPLASCSNTSSIRS